MEARAVIVGYGETPVSRGRIERGEEQLTLEYLAWCATTWSVPLKKMRIGMRVEVVFDDVTDAVSLAKFRPSEL